MALALINFNLVRMENRSNYNLVCSTGPYNYSAIGVVDRNHRTFADFEMEILSDVAVCVGDSSQGQYDHELGSGYSMGLHCVTHGLFPDHYCSLRSTAKS